MKPINTDSTLRSRRRFAAGAIATAVLLSACASYQPIAQNTAPIDKLALTAPGSIAQTADAWPKDEWWQAFGDAQLNRLIQQALAASPNLATAQARIARAQASADLSRAAAGPQATGALDASYGRQSENYVMPRPPLGKGGEYVSQGVASIGFGYDLDLWGRNAALIRSAEAQLKAARFDQQAARLALTTSVARTYAQLAAQYQLHDVLLATQQQRQAIRRLINQRVSSGLDTQVEVKTAESNEAALRVELEQLSTTMKITRLQLAALTGQMPDAGADILKPTLVPASFSVPHDLPLDLLGRRPELAVQRARIAASYGESDAAKAQFYPNINLNGLIGFQSIGLGQLLSAGSLMSSIGPAIRLPLFDGGRLRANYASKAADIDVAISQYNQSVLSAAQDVAEQLTRAADLSREEGATREALAAAEEAHRLAMLRYRAGLTPYLNVLTVETQLLTQRRAMATVTSRRQDLQIELVRALGGGFSENPTAALAGSSTTTAAH
jgi:NodT family efflux transporter outer membrane factor (OMF) lipoprotein